MSTSKQSRVLITGGASGIGLETSLQLARLGHHAIIADRDAVGGKAAVDSIMATGGTAEFRQLDLADLSQIRTFASDELSRDLPLDVLINNAGILPPRERATTRDGFELEFGIAHLGHFALTGLLLPALNRSEHPRVVSVSSNSHPGGRIDFDNLQFERKYSSTLAYTSTKLACLIFGVELHRRAIAARSDIISVSAHPGVSRTPIAKGWEQEDRRGFRERFELAGYHMFMRFLSQSAAQGAESLVYAATQENITGGGYYGPTGFKQMGGPPGLVQPASHALDESVAVRLWDVSEQLTGVSIRL